MAKKCGKKMEKMMGTESSMPSRKVLDGVVDIASKKKCISCKNAKCSCKKKK